jgi:hypothetical protein
MIDRLYDNGMLTSGEARHYNSWDLPTMPRLQRTGAVVPVSAEQVGMVQLKKQGAVAALWAAIRSRKA